jgi:NAD(P)-dependent dehydrogenase (short-subunit alcohol dehydrogenase family)
MFSLKNKVAVITGGGSGIGQAIAVLFAKQGAIIHILELTEEAGFETKNSINSAEGDCTIYQCNVTDQKAVLSVFQKIGSLDILVNNAGIAHVGTVETTTEEDFDRVYATNVKGVFNVIKSAIPLMKDKGGVILNMASIAAMVGIPDRFAYSTSKGAVLSLTLSIAKDYLSYNIRCNSISPARVYTPFVEGFLNKNYPDNKAEMFEKLSKSQPIGRMGTPEEVAALALYLCSDEASFVTGCDYPIDGGFLKLNN